MRPYQISSAKQQLAFVSESAGKKSSSMSVRTSWYKGVEEGEMVKAIFSRSLPLSSRVFKRNVDEL